MEQKSNEQIVTIIQKKIEMILMEQLPNPQCALKRQHNEWKKEQIRKAIAEKLSSETK